MAGFSAQAGNGQVEVAWATAKETEILGFDVLRSESENGPFAPVNPELIPALTPGGSQGNRYSFVDSSAAPARNYWYKLRILTLDGGSTEYGPAALIPAAQNRIFLPSVGR